MGVWRGWGACAVLVFLRFLRSFADSLWVVVFGDRERPKRRMVSEGAKRVKEGRKADLRFEIKNLKFEI